MWLLANKKKFWIWFASVFVILLLIGTFLDYQINDLVADLRHGSYISSNTYATLMEVLGESPVYLFLTYSFVIIGLNLSLNNGTKFKVFAGLSIAVACFCMYKVLHGYCKYIYEHVENDIWTSIGMQITCIVLGILLTVLATFLFYRFTNFEDYLKFAIMIILTATISQAFVQGVKLFAGRERFRTTYYLTKNHRDHIGFTYWFMFNGSCSKLGQLYGVPADYYKSFPSGHTCSSAIVYTLLLLPSLLKRFDNMKYKVIATISTVAFTGMVAFGRLVAGAHYMTDVLFGGTATFLSIIAAYYLYYFIVKKIDEKKNKKTA